VAILEEINIHFLSPWWAMFQGKCYNTLLARTCSFCISDAIVFVSSSYFPKEFISKYGKREREREKVKGRS
jgi:hypothetical protein